LKIKNPPDLIGINLLTIPLIQKSVKELTEKGLFGILPYMTLKNYLIIMGVITSLAWGLFLLLINTINPFTTNTLGFILFYSILFLSLSGSIAIIGFFIRFKLLKEDLIFNSVKTAFRQSFIFSLLITVVLYLLSQKLFSWFNLFLLIIILSLAEFLMLDRRRHPKSL